jgi:hypothetical protein
MSIFIRCTLFLTALMVLGVSQDAEARKRRKRKGPPPTGWVDGETGTPACYHTPIWDGFNEIDRRMKRSEAMDEVLNQWRGLRNDGINLDPRVIEEVETVLLGRPEKIEKFVVDNLAHCLSGDAAAWSAWSKGLKAVLTAGECNTPLDYTMFDYLDIGSGWQRPLNICKGNSIRISGSARDMYRLSDESPWITVLGDPAISTLSPEWPCNLEGCKAGMLTMRFVAKGSGVETIVAVGASAMFTAPADGVISYRINDTSFFDNIWHTSGSVIDHTAIEVSPAK